jgi:hypothetical protein
VWRRRAAAGGGSGKTGSHSLETDLWRAAAGGGSGKTDSHSLETNLQMLDPDCDIGGKITAAGPYD